MSTPKVIGSYKAQTFFFSKPSQNGKKKLFRRYYYHHGELNWTSTMTTDRASYTSSNNNNKIEITFSSLTTLISAPLASADFPHWTTISLLAFQKQNWRYLAAQWHCGSQCLFPPSLQNDRSPSFTLPRMPRSRELSTIPPDRTVLLSWLSGANPKSTVS